MAVQVGGEPARSIGMLCTLCLAGRTSPLSCSPALQVYALMLPQPAVCCNSLRATGHASPHLHRHPPLPQPLVARPAPAAAARAARSWT